jgi:indolepyruvate ferredoxin oxidoreductase beta subunit
MTQPVKLLIAAMGGEGGGVLMDWIVGACWKLGYPVQATSVPGVAQRTGATTYYIELVPEAGAKRPVFALVPTPGEVDLMLATELAEAVRAIQQGFVTKERTTLVSSTHRFYATDEKIALGDGRLSDARLRQVAEAGAKASILFDAAAAAREAKTVINAVMLGAIAATGLLKIAPEEFTKAIQEEGKAVAANLAGFKLGFEQLNKIAPAPVTAVEPDVVRIGVERLIDYQGAAYAELYRRRLEKFRDGDPQLYREVARHLAVRMSYEDIIRVAQAKVRTRRFARIRTEASAKESDLVTVTEFFKPGVQEFADIAPPSLARWLLGRSGARKWAWAMHVRSTTVTGFLKIWLLSKLRWWRPSSYRYAEEQAAIESWLDLVDRASRREARLALEVAELARLIKGYGSTHRRGSANYRHIVEALVLPTLADDAAHPNAANRIANAREAALKDPDGIALSLALASVAPKLARAAE